MYTGAVFGADEALAGGLVSKVVDGDDLLPRAREIAEEISERTAPVSIALIRQALWKGLGVSHPAEALHLEVRMTQARRHSPDGTEGVPLVPRAARAAVHRHGQRGHAGPLPLVGVAHVDRSVVA